MIAVQMPRLITATTTEPYLADNFTVIFGEYIPSTGFIRVPVLL